MIKFLKLPKILVPLITGILIIGQGIGLVYFSQKNKEISDKINSLNPDYEKLVKENKELKNKYADLVKESEKVKEDRNNILVQLKGLFAEKNRAQELAVALDKSNKEAESFQKEKNEAREQNTGLKEELKKLQDLQAQITQERDGLKAAYEKISSESTIKELTDENAGLRGEKNELQIALKQAQRELEQFKEKKSKSDSEKDMALRQMEGYKKNYALAVRKNKLLEQEIMNLPKKFTEIARQNKLLIKQTSEMHYNLGVFYTKNKEYSRAIAEFEKVVEIAPDDAQAHFNLGYIFAEYLIDRKKAIDHLRLFLRNTKNEDSDSDWARKYILTWETYNTTKPME